MSAPGLTIVPWPAPTAETAELMRVLEACRERVLAGHTEAFVFVSLNRDRRVTRAHALGDKANVFQLLGALTHESRYLSERLNEMSAPADLSPELDA